jgi:hypothetical protein
MQTSLSHIFYDTDLTQGGQPKIPLGFMLEAVWPEQARWLGVIGRDHLMPFELDLIGKLVRPMFATRPFDVPSQILSAGWRDPWGKAGSSWPYMSAIQVEPVPEAGEHLTPVEEGDWARGSMHLYGQLLSLRTKLQDAVGDSIKPLPRMGVLPTAIRSTSCLDCR